MTGFGSATVDFPGGRLAVEARSVNHRFSEVQVRLPRDLAPLEDRARALVLEQVRRGRVDVAVTREEDARRPRTVRADTELASAYLGALREMAEAVGVSGEITLAQIVSLPDVLRVEEDRADLESLWPSMASALRQATEGMVAMRAAEGARLAEDLLGRVAALEQMTDAVAGRSREVVREHGERLRLRLAEMLAQAPVDEARIATELALFAERSDITEELVRLRSHLAQFRQTVTEAEGAVGRKLEFLLQEIARETNTIGSKANNLEIARAIIAMKSETESMREQVQNVE
jgi:uncharacterized protein (TIGR00255 family)